MKTRVLAAYGGLPCAQLLFGHTNRQTNGQTFGYTNRLFGGTNLIFGHTNSQTNGQTFGHTNRQTNWTDVGTPQILI